MTAEEREAWLDHPAASGDPPEEEDEQDWDAEPLTAAELAEIGEAAADEMLAAGATAHAGDRPGPIVELDPITTQDCDHRSPWPSDHEGTPCQQLDVAVRGERGRAAGQR